MKIRIHATMKACLTAILSLFILSSSIAQKTLNSGVYEWKNLKAKGKYGIQVRNILKSPTRSLGMFEINAFTLIGGYSVKEYRIKEGIDELIIIKEGSAVISVNERTERLGEGSIVVASQGDVIKILNGAKNDLTFYSFKFKPRQSAGMTPISKKTEPFIKDWNDIEYKVNANGGRRDIIQQPVTALKELEMHTTQLKEGLPSHTAHTHPDEEIILVRFGKVEESIKGNPFQSGPGSIIFLSNDDDHGIRNVDTGPCEYYAIRWLTY
ncbi:MAG: cupin domain-containing protein [Bacteroidia bacterium]|nr:cupin domain-containing protein [Bacteroidia bacterium]